MKTFYYLLMLVASALIISVDVRAGDSPPVPQGAPNAAPAEPSPAKPDAVPKDNAAAATPADRKIRMGVSVELGSQADEVIKNGKIFLLTKQTADGNFGLYADSIHKVGGQAFILYTLSKNDVPAEDEWMTRGRKYLRTIYELERDGATGTSAYSAGAILLYFSECCDRQRRKYDDVHGWREKKPKPFEFKISPEEQTWIKEVVARLEKLQNADNGAWSSGTSTKAPEGPAKGGATPTPFDKAKAGETWGEMSNTHWALLGLHDAARMGYPVSKPELYKKAADYLMGCQDSDGPQVPRVEWEILGEGKYNYALSKQTKYVDRARGWACPVGVRDKAVDGSKPVYTGAMTAAAVAGLVVCRAQMVEAKLIEEDDACEKKLRQSIFDGLAWLGKAFTVERNPVRGVNYAEIEAPSTQYYYYLWCLERAGMVAGQDFFGDHEWRARGVEYLVTAAKANNSGWTARTNPDAKPEAPSLADPIADTCYVLLFLKGQYVRPFRTAGTPQGRPKPQ